jgi:hypothetical protein
VIAPLPPTAHPTVLVNLGGHRVPIDEGIVPLIIALWRLRLWTAESCQGGEGTPWGDTRAYVVFAERSSRSAFRLLLRRGGQRFGVQPLDFHHRCWDPDPDWRHSTWNWSHAGRCPMVRFPYWDLPEVTLRARWCAAAASTEQLGLELPPNAAA